MTAQCLTNSSKSLSAILSFVIDEGSSEKSHVSFVDVSREIGPKHPWAQGQVPGVEARDLSSSASECHSSPGYVVKAQECSHPGPSFLILPHSGDVGKESHSQLCLRLQVSVSGEGKVPLPHQCLLPASSCTTPKTSSISFSP